MPEAVRTNTIKLNATITVGDDEHVFIVEMPVFGLEGNPELGDLQCLSEALKRAMIRKYLP